MRRVIPTGLDLTGTAKGVIHGRFPGAEGEWLGVANYEIGYADGRRNKLYVVDQLVPFWALTKRCTEYAAAAVRPGRCAFRSLSQPPTAPLPYTVVRRLADPRQRSVVDAGRSEVLTRTDGVDLALFVDSTALGVMRRLHPELRVESLVAGTDD